MCNHAISIDVFGDFPGPGRVLGVRGVAVEGKDFAVGHQLPLVVAGVDGVADEAADVATGLVLDAAALVGHGAGALVDVERIAACVVEEGAVVASDHVFDEAGGQLGLLGKLPGDAVACQVVGVAAELAQVVVLDFDELAGWLEFECFPKGQTTAISYAGSTPPSRVPGLCQIERAQ